MTEIPWSVYVAVGTIGFLILSGFLYMLLAWRDDDLMDQDE